MPRRPTQTFRCSPLENLLRQLLFAPGEKRIEQVARIERLHDEIDPGTTYPLDYLVYRITRYRRMEGESGSLLVGEAVLPDLRMMLDKLTRSVDLPIDAEPGTQTAEQLAARFDVSGKTIDRWRKDGLRWRWVVPPTGGRKVVGFTPAAVDRFVALNRDRVAKASRFTHLEPEDRHRLIEQARRLAAAHPEWSLNQVAAELAPGWDRALETVRQILEKHDQEHPDDRLFEEEGPLTARDKRIIARAYHMGVSVPKIAQRFGRARSTIYRVVHERRAAAARRLRLDFVESPNFARPDADEVLLRGEIEPFPDSRPRTVSGVPVDDLPEPLRPVYRQPQIDEERQRSLFVRFNYLKYKAAKIRDALDPYEPRAADLDAFEGAVKRARRIRDLLVKSNLPTVLSVAKRHLLGQADRSTHRLLGLLELGVPVLIDAVDQYNPFRGRGAVGPQRFDSFLTNRLLQHFAASEAGADTARKAQRRISAEDLLARMVNQAQESGVELSLDD